MKRLISRLFLGLLSLILVAVAAVSIVCLLFLKPIVTNQIQSRTGFNVKIEKITLNPFTANMVIDGFVLTNPASEFKTPGFVDLRALHGEISLPSLFSDRIVVNSAKLDLPSVTLVNRAKGGSNAKLFEERLSQGMPEPASQPSGTPPEPEKPLNFLIKQLDVNVGKLVVVNEPAAGDPTSKDYNINLNCSYKDITDPKQFLTQSPDLAKSLLGIGGQLTDLIPGKLGDSVNSVIKSGLKVLDDPESAAGSAVQGLLDKIAPKK